MEEYHVWLVPGGKVYPKDNLVDGKVRGSTQLRCDKVIRVIQERKLPVQRIVTLGGVAHSPKVQRTATAELASAALVNGGVPVQMVTAIGGGRDTFEELQLLYLARKTLVPNRQKPVFHVVTHPLHGARCVHILQVAYGLQAVVEDAGYEISRQEAVVERVFMVYTRWDPDGSKLPAKLMRESRSHY